MRVRVRTALDPLADALHAVYGAFAPEDDAGVFDATAAVRPVCGLRRWVRPQIELVSAGERVFEPFPASTHLPMLEWGLNYLIATQANQHLLLHAGALEHRGVGLLLPALPGSGKSTLTAALACHGYRLLSDEFGVITLRDRALRPLLRPVGLKNASIDVIAGRAPQAVLGPRFPETRKGVVAHLAPDARAVAGRRTDVAPGLILFPHYEPGAALRLEPVEPERAFSKLSVNSFNYRLLGPSAFDAALDVARRCPAHRLVYGDLDAAIDAVDELVERAAAPVAELEPA